MTRVLVSGATGFVGQQLCEQLARVGFVVRAALRTDRAVPVCIAEKIVCGNINGATQWSTALENVDFVVHAAARTHVLHDTPVNTRLYVETNADGTQALAAESARRGVRRFIYLSSVKVNGEGSAQRAYRADDEPRPQDAYGRSKWLAEQRLWETVAAAPMQAAVVRSPLVYGPGVRANFLRLLRCVDRERFLPLGAVRNQRSLVSIWSLCDLLIRLLEHPAASGRTWMVSDGEDVSTPELVRRIARAMDRSARLVSVPPQLLRMTGGLLGKGSEVRRLCGSLTVDIAPTRARLGWSPPVSMDEALARTVSWYQSQRQRPK
jgi:nucleoside-diphosphate-sugar epimerase